MFIKAKLHLLWIFIKKIHKMLLMPFLSSSVKTKASRRRILFSLPIHTISNNLLFKILKHNNVSAESIKSNTRICRISERNIKKYNRTKCN